MLKKILVKCILVLAITCFSNLLLSSEAEARDVWVYNGGNIDYYVVTESISHQKGGPITVTTKNVENGRLLGRGHFEFYADEGSWWYGGGEVKPNTEAKAILDYCRDYLNR